MFTRPVYGTEDMDAQHALLDEVARLVDAGRLRTTLAERMTPIDAANLRRAHGLLEDGWTQGKIVLEGFQGVCRSFGGRRRRALSGHCGRSPSRASPRVTQTGR